MASKKSRDGINKSALIRRYPNLAASEIVAKIKADHRVTVSAPLVYAIRSADKGKSGGKGPGRTPKVGKVSSASGLGNINGAIRAMVKDELRAILSQL